MQKWWGLTGWGPWDHPDGIRSAHGVGRCVSECDTHWPTEDSTYIFYDLGKLSPVTFVRLKRGWAVKGTSHVSVVWLINSQEGTHLP